MECMKSIYHTLIEKLRKRKRLAMQTVCAPDGSVTKTLAAPEDAAGECACRENCVQLERNVDGSLCLYEPFERQERLIILGDGEATRMLTQWAAARSFSVIVADETPDIAAHLPEAEQTICDALASAARCLHITDEDSVILAPRRYSDAAACVEQLWEEPQTAFLGLIDPSSKKNWLFRLENDGVADAAWLERMTVVEMSDGPESAARAMLHALEAVCGETAQHGENRDVIELLARLPADRLEERKAVLTVAQAADRMLLGRKMVVFEDGCSVGSLSCALDRQVRDKLNAHWPAYGWMWMQVDAQTGVLIEAD